MSNMRAKWHVGVLDSRAMADDLSRILSADLEDDGDLVVEGTPAAADARRIHRPARGQGQPVGAAPGGQGQGRGGRPRPPVRPARPRQDDPRDDHRPRARGQRPLHLGPGDRAGRRPRRDPHVARRARRPVHRRDPPPQPRGRGDPLPGDGGLRARRDDRQGPVAPGRLRLSLKPFTVVGATTRAGRISSPLRDRFGATYRLDFYDEDELAADRRAARPRSSSVADRRGRDPGHRPARTGHAAHRQPAAQAGPRPRPGPRRRPRRRGDRDARRCARWRSTTRASTPTDRKLLAAIIQKFASGPVGVAALAAVLSEEVETIEDVYEPFLLRLGFLDRTPQGRIATDLGAGPPGRAGLRDPAAAPRRPGMPGLWDGPAVVDPPVTPEA